MPTHERPLPPESIRRMVALYQSGASLETCGRTVGLSPTAARRRLVARGVEIRRRGPRLVGVPDQQRLRIVDDYAAGLPLTDIYRRSGLNATVVKRVLLEEGVRLREVQGRPHVVTLGMRRQFVELYLAGLSMEAIGIKFGVSRRTVWRHVHAHGVASGAGGRRSKVRPAHWAAIVRASERGVPLATIAAAHETSVDVIRRIIKKYNNGNQKGENS